MNIIDAIKSGKKFRRFGHGWNSPNFTCTGFSSEDILANDWEIGEEKIEVTKEQVNHAIWKTRHDFEPYTNSWYTQVYKELGFKEI